MFQSIYLVPSPLSFLFGPCFTALQYVDNLETKRSYKRKVHLKNINFFKKKLSSGLKIVRLFVKEDQNVYKTAIKSASIHTNQSVLSSNRLELSP